MLARVTLDLFLIAIGLDLGAGFYEHRVVVPLWEGTLATVNPDTRVATLAGARFWRFMTPALALITLAAFASGFGATGPYRTWQLAATGLQLAVIAATATFFIPTIIQLTKPGAAVALGAGVVTAKAQTWVTMNWVRMAVTLAAWAAGLRALSLPM